MYANSVRNGKLKSWKVAEEEELRYNPPLTFWQKNIMWMAITISNSFHDL